jgi:hypothetical protein
MASILKRLFVLAFCVLGTLALSRGQDANPHPGTALLAGTVVKEPGNQPIKKVLLHLVAEDQKNGGNYTADTDAEGRFRIENVQPARYRLLLEKTGFHAINLRGRQAENTILTVRAGQEMTDLLFEMSPAAVITGRVVDRDGDPLSGYGVTLLHKRPGEARDPELAGEERTNDLGEYRLSGLFQGRYFVAVVPQPDIRNFVHTKEPPAKESKPDLAYLTTYYPGTTDFSQASAVDLRAGDEMPVNFTLIPSRSYRLRGLVTGVPVNQKPMVQLISRGVGQTVNGADVASDGQFEIRGVAPGSYSITVFSGSEGQILSARESVAVVAADVEGIKLAPVRPFTVTGTLRFDAPLRKLVMNCSVYLRPVEDDDSAVGPSAVSSAQVDRFGNFQWTGIMPGTYVAQFNGGDVPELYLKYVRIGASNADGSFRLTGPASVEVVVSPKSGTLEGVVVDHDQPASNATVVVVPEEKYRKLTEHFYSGSTDQNGHFSIRGLAPGSYSAFAWQDVDEDLYRDAGFLKSQESNGVSLKVEEESREKIQLKVSTVGEEWQ